MRQNVFVGDAAHVTKLTEGAELTHATKFNKE